MSIKRRKTRMINNQRRKNSCGPTALANVLKWLKYPTSHDHMVAFCEGNQLYDPEVGMYSAELFQMLKILTMDFSYRQRIVTRELDQALDSGKGVILLYKTEEATYHAVFIDAKTPKKYRVWNSGLKVPGTPWLKRGVVTKAIKRTLKTNKRCEAFIFGPNQ